MHLSCPLLVGGKWPLQLGSRARIPDWQLAVFVNNLERGLCWWLPAHADGSQPVFHFGGLCHRWIVLHKGMVRSYGIPACGRESRSEPTPGAQTWDLGVE